VFFRKRHDDEAALRRFAHESSYITDRAILLERTEREVKEHTSAEDVAILVRDGSASYASTSNGERVTISENDPGILALRAWHKPVDLHAVSESELRGEYAFPMISRGELVGVLICGAKHDNEVYAPDESDALLTLAHGVGTTLATLSGRGDTAMESAKETQALIVEKFDALMSQVRRALPPLQ
jgi:GAF domain-containing protein